MKEAVNKLAVVITTPPYDNLTTTAIEFIKAAINDQTKIIGVFFYQMGVLNASKNLSLPSDEFQTIKEWRHLADQHQIPLHLCSTAAEKHGLMLAQHTNNAEALSLIDNSFTLSGLGELVELTSNADRVVQL